MKLYEYGVIALHYDRLFSVYGMGGMHFQCFYVMFARLDFKLARALAISRRWIRRCRFRSPDLGVTAVTSEMGHTTDLSDADLSSASVRWVGAPSRLGPH